MNIVNALENQRKQIFNQRLYYFRTERPEGIGVMFCGCRRGAAVSKTTEIIPLDGQSPWALTMKKTLWPLCGRHRRTRRRLEKK